MVIANLARERRSSKRQRCKTRRAPSAARAHGAATVPRAVRCASSEPIDFGISLEMPPSGHPPENRRRFNPIRQTRPNESVSIRKDRACKVPRANWRPCCSSLFFGTDSARAMAKALVLLTASERTSSLDISGECVTTRQKGMRRPLGTSSERDTRKGTRF